MQGPLLEILGVEWDDDLEILLDVDPVASPLPEEDETHPFKRCGGFFRRQGWQDAAHTLTRTSAMQVASGTISAPRSRLHSMYSANAS